MSKKYRIVQTPQFKADFRQALRYIAAVLRNRIAADALITEFHEAASHLAAFPFTSEPLTSRSGTPYYSVAVKNYLAYYVVLEETVEFRRFLYAPSDIPNRIE